MLVLGAFCAMLGGYVGILLSLHAGLEALPILARIFDGCEENLHDKRPGIVAWVDDLQRFIQTHAA